LWLADYRLACQLGGTDDDNLIIRNLPLFLSDAARAWLEHLPPAQISNWDDLVKAFAGNFQGTYTIAVERREEGHALLVQRPVYFISEVLSETKICYPQIQKLLYAVILTRQKLRHYFESHPVTVVSSFPLAEIIQ
jgi:hypothetical protein